jgi:hypothetical protein
LIRLFPDTSGRFVKLLSTKNIIGFARLTRGVYLTSTTGNDENPFAAFNARQRKDGMVTLMKCPHCRTAFHENWRHSSIDGGSRYWQAQALTCPECKKDTLQLGVTDNGTYPATWRQIFPIGSSRAPVPTEVPGEIVADYNEAASVLPVSAKASAALARRCLQSVLREQGYAQRDLSQQIDAALNEQDTRKALPTAVHTIVDAVRNFGNFSAHRITDQTTLQLIDVEPHEAEYCLDILDALFDHYYVRPAHAHRMKTALNAKLAAARKPAAK